MQVWTELVLEVAVMAARIIAVAAAHSRNVLLCLLLVLICAAVASFWHTRQDLIFLVTGAVVGPVAEIVCVHFGVWQYANPSFLGIPVWLPLAWGFVTMLIGRIAGTLSRVKTK